MHEIDLGLNFRNKKALSLQVQEGIRRLIADGMLHPGDQLPTVRELAIQFNINFNTVARAYRNLDQEGWITTRQGRGTYVLDRSQAENEESPLSHQDMIQQLVSRLVEDAGRLGIQVEELSEALSKYPRSKSPKDIKQPKARKRIAQKKQLHSLTGYQRWRVSEESSNENLRKIRRVWNRHR